MSDQEQVALQTQIRDLHRPHDQHRQHAFLYLLQPQQFLWFARQR